MINSRNLIYTNILDLTCSYSKHPLEMTLLLFKVYCTYMPNHIFINRESGNDNISIFYDEPRTIGSVISFQAKLKPASATRRSLDGARELLVVLIRDYLPRSPLQRQYMSLGTANGLAPSSKFEKHGRCVSGWQCVRSPVLGRWGGGVCSPSSIFRLSRPF